MGANGQEITRCRTARITMATDIEDKQTYGDDEASY